MIRKLEKKDLGEVMDIWLSSNLEAHDFVDASYWKNNFDYAADMIAKSEVYIYEKDDKILGFLGLMDGYVAGIFVRKKDRSKGIGKKLMDYAKSIHKKLYLDVYQLNEKAVDFYKREGFLIIDRHLNTDTGKIEYTMEFDN